MASKKKKYAEYTVSLDGIVRKNTARDEEDRSGWLQGSEGNFLQTVAGSATDIAENVGAGIMGLGESIVDTAAFLGPLFQQAQFNANGGYYNTHAAKVQDSAYHKQKKESKEFIEQDLYDEEKVANALIGGPVKALTGVDAETMSIFGEKSDALAQSAGQLIGAQATNAVIPGSGLALVGTSAFGSEVENAFRQGASYEEAGGSALVSAGAEVLTEQLFGGIKFGKGTLTDNVVKEVTEGVSNKALKAMTKYGIEATGEGLEEVLSQVASNIGSAAYKEEELLELLTNEEAVEGYIDSAIGGIVLGSVAGGVNIAHSKATGKGYVSGLTANEQKVVDAEVEKRIEEQEADGKKLSTHEKTKIRDKVVEDMDKGYITIDSIESALGGETFETYRAVEEKEKSLREEIDELEQLPAQQITVKQSERLSKAREELSELEKTSDKTKLKERLASEVQELTKNERLAESYNERGRRSQAYEADLSKYSKTQQETVQRAVDSGILNNTNRTHEFVDMIARISADKGVSFDFTNNQKLKESGFALEGRTVNGYVQGGNVTLNVNSAKALNKVVGHEITHVLEGTELYTELQNSIIEYAKSKGDYEARIKSLEELYKDVEGTDIIAELTADLVGDYLFSDSDFVNGLSAEQPGIFQKIYEEIKYMVKTTTAGSKEAKQLLELQRTFERAYTESGKTTDGSVRYSLGEIVDEDNTSYGIGVYLDSTLLDNLSPNERIEIIKEYVKELGGEIFGAYDVNGNAVDVRIIDSKKFQNSKGKKVPANKDLKTKYIKNEIKQEAITLIDELVLTAKFDGGKKAKYPHGWIDNNGQNDWEYWKTYIQDKNNTIWEVVLNIANSSNGEKILYDISPIKKVGRSVKSDTLPTHKSISQSTKKSSDSQETEDSTDVTSTSSTFNQNTNLSLSEQEDVLPIRGDIYGKDISLDIPIRSDIALVQEDAAVRDIPIRDDVLTSGVVPIEEIAELPEEVFTDEELEELQSELIETDREKIEEEWRKQQKEALATQKALAKEKLGAKDTYISNRAKELYEELLSLRKGVRASKELGYLLDFGEQSKGLRTALVNTKARPLKTVNQNSYIESIVRDMLENEYNSKMTEIEHMVLPEDGEIKRRITRKVIHERLVNTIKHEMQSKGFDLDTVLNNANYKRGIGAKLKSKDNTPQRYMEKLFGYKEGQILSDMTVNRTAKNESKGIRWLNQFTDRKNGKLSQLSKKYKIKPGSKEDAAAQKYAEGRYVNKFDEYVEYGDAELAKEFPDIETQERIRGLATDPLVREIYDTTLDQINASYERNGYEPIPKRKNYFLHFIEGEDFLSNIGYPLSPNSIKAKDLPTELEGMTTDFKPGRQYFGSSHQRKGIRTTYSLLGGMEKYLTAAKNQIYHIDDIQVYRALHNYVAKKFGQAEGLENLDMLSEAEQEQLIKQVYNAHLGNFAGFLNEQANVVAGKTPMLDRGFEEVFDRRLSTVFSAINRQLSSNMVGLNVGSSLTNLISGVQAFAKANNKFDAIKAFAQTFTNRFNSMLGKDSDNFAESNDAIVRRKGAEQFHRRAWDKWADTGFAFMSAIDDVTTEFIVRTKYNELTRKGMNSEQAHDEAGKWAMRILGDRSLGQMPQMYNSKILGIFTKFQLEVRNQLDSMFYDTIQEAKADTETIENTKKRNMATASKVTSTMVQLAVLQHVFGKAFESAAGYNPTFDIVDAFLKLLGADDEEDSEDTFGDNVRQAAYSLAEDLPYSSLLLDGGRIPIGNALPIGKISTELLTGEDENGSKDDLAWAKTLAEAIPYYLLPTGYGQIKKSVQGLSMFDDDLPIAGSYTGSGKLRYPVEDTLQNRTQAAVFGQYANENARDYFENERSPLTANQTQELVELDIPIRDYWDYREQLKGLYTMEEKAEYIAGLDLPIDKKNIMINNLTDRKDDIDMAEYELYEDLDEMDFAIKNKGKYAIAQAIGGYSTYKSHTSALNGLESEKDASGRIINGSRKEKVVGYIDGLNIDYGQKILLYKSQYPSDNTYNADIVEYLNNRKDITYADMVEILQELGFTVESNGTVRW